MRITYSEFNEFVARFHCAASYSAKHCVTVEIETASGDVGSTAYVSDDVSSKAADWLKRFRTAAEVSGIIGPVAAQSPRAADIPVAVAPPRSTNIPVTTAQSLGPAIAPPSVRLGDEAISAGFEAFRRDCPKCARRIMRAATKCGYCWSRLDPVADLPGAFLVEMGPTYTEPLPASGSKRPCPRCGNRIMPDATLCGFCWVSVSPL
jgi:hypothetical protein